MKLYRSELCSQVCGSYIKLTKSPPLHPTVQLFNQERFAPVAAQIRLSDLSLCFPSMPLETMCIRRRFEGEQRLSHDSVKKDKISQNDGIHNLYCTWGVITFTSREDPKNNKICYPLICGENACPSFHFVFLCE